MRMRICAGPWLLGSAPTTHIVHKRYGSGDGSLTRKVILYLSVTNEYKFTKISAGDFDSYDLIIDNTPM